MNRKLALVFVLLTVAIDSIGIGIIIPVMPDLIREVGAADLADAALWGGALAATFSLMQLICSPAVGSLSDRYGRRPVLLISLFFMTLDYILLGIAHLMWLLFLGRIIGGITASTPATVTAFISDISKPEEKAKNFGLIGAAFGIGFVLGPLFGAFFAEFGTRAPFYAAAAFAGCNLLLGWFVLPETVTDEIRRPFEWKRANPVGSIYHLAKLPGLRTFMMIMLIFQIAFTVYPAVWSFYTIERFGWDPAMIGFSLAAYGVMIAVVQGWFIRIILKYLSERQTLLFGMFFELIGLLGYGFVTETWMAFVLIPISSIGSVATPALQGMMSRIALDNQQGELHGVNASLISLAFFLSPLVMTGIFYVFVSPDFPIYLPGAPFLLASLMIVACMILIMLFTRETDPRAMPDPRP